MATDPRNEVERTRRQRTGVVAASLHLATDLVLPSVARATLIARFPPPSYDDRTGLNSPARPRSPDTALTRRLRVPRPRPRPRPPLRRSRPLPQPRQTSARVPTARAHSANFRPRWRRGGDDPSVSSLPALHLVPDLALPAALVRQPRRTQEPACTSSVPTRSGEEADTAHTRRSCLPPPRPRRLRP